MNVWMNEWIDGRMDVWMDVYLYFVVVSTSNRKYESLDIVRGHLVMFLQAWYRQHTTLTSYNKSAKALVCEALLSAKAYAQVW